MSAEEWMERKAARRPELDALSMDNWFDFVGDPSPKPITAKTRKALARNFVFSRVTALHEWCERKKRQDGGR